MRTWFRTIGGLILFVGVVYGQEPVKIEYGEIQIISPPPRAA